MNIYVYVCDAARLRLVSIFFLVWVRSIPAKFRSSRAHVLILLSIIALIASRVLPLKRYRYTNSEDKAFLNHFIKKTKKNKRDITEFSMYLLWRPERCRIGTD